MQPSVTQDMLLVMSSSLLTPGAEMLHQRKENSTGMDTQDVDKKIKSDQKYLNLYELFAIQNNECSASEFRVGNGADKRTLELLGAESPVRPEFLENPEIQDKCQNQNS